jgi:hypothetical protein
MKKSVYDTNSNSIVDNSEKLEGQDGTFYLTHIKEGGGTTLSVSSITDGQHLARSGTNVVGVDSPSGLGSAGKVSIWASTTSLSFDSSFSYNTSTDALTVGPTVINNSGKITGVTQGTATGEVIIADRTINAGTGLTGGGNLTADRTFSIAGFTGVIRKEDNPALTTYSTGRTTLSSYDIGTNGVILLMRVNLPQRVVADLFGEFIAEFSDGTTFTYSNNTNATVQKTREDILTDIYTAASNGKKIKKAHFVVVNNVGIPTAGDFSTFGFSGDGLPIGDGAAL